VKFLYHGKQDIGDVIAILPDLFEAGPNDANMNEVAKKVCDQVGQTNYKMITSVGVAIVR
jgi:hypothetical protein